MRAPKKGSIQEMGKRAPNMELVVGAPKQAREVGGAREKRLKRPAHGVVAGATEKKRKRPSLLNIPFSDFKESIHFYIRNKWQDRWSNLQSNLKLKAIRPSIAKWLSSCHSDRRSEIILARLRIGHTHATHSYLMSSEEGRRAPYCNTCHCDMTVKHILINCNVFNGERRASSLHGRTMSEMLNDDCNVDKLMGFLKSIGFYHKF